MLVITALVSFCGIESFHYSKNIIKSSAVLSSFRLKMSSFSTCEKDLVIDPFAERQFNNPNYTGLFVFLIYYSNYIPYFFIFVKGPK